jgi:hypothetical protein
VRLRIEVIVRVYTAARVISLLSKNDCYMVKLCEISKKNKQPPGGVFRMRYFSAASPTPTSSSLPHPNPPFLLLPPMLQPQTLSYPKRICRIAHSLTTAFLHGPSRPKPGGSASALGKSPVSRRVSLSIAMASIRSRVRLRASVISNESSPRRMDIRSSMVFGRSV